MASGPSAVCTRLSTSRKHEYTITLRSLSVAFSTISRRRVSLGESAGLSVRNAARRISMKFPEATALRYLSTAAPSRGSQSAVSIFSGSSSSTSAWFRRRLTRLADLWKASALTALLGDITPEMTIRCARVAPPIVRDP